MTERAPDERPPSTPDAAYPPAESPAGRPLAPGDPVAGQAPAAKVPAVGEPELPAELEAVYREGLEIKPRSQWDLARARFLRHKLAMGSLVVLAIIFAAGIVAPALTPYEFDVIDLPQAELGPTLQDRHWFGTDELGRDYFTRVLFGVRTTISVALLVAVIATAVGTLVGALAGYYGGWLDNLLMRFTDLVLTLPFLAVLLTAAAFLGQGQPVRVALIVAGLSWTYLARIVRGTFLSLKEKEFVEAARAMGASDARMMLRHLLPNSLGPIIVNATLTVATAILIEAALSFLGFGVRPPNPALGVLISDGQGRMLDLWWLVTIPGVVIVTICLCVNFIGDGLRDALDPTQARVRA